MLLWLEEAAIEITMILAVTVGAVMFVAAVWYHVGELVRQGTRHRERIDAQPASARAVTMPAGTTHPSGHHA